jgi:histidinol-phosphate aminotransferase
MSKPDKRSCLDLIQPYVPGKPVEEVERELGLQDVIKLASNENLLGPSPLALQALERVLPRLHYYPDGNSFYLKQALAEKWGVEPDQLILGNGSDELLRLLTTAYINPGDEAVTARPSFSEYEFALRLMGGVPCAVPLAGAGFEYDLPALSGAFTGRTRLVFICSPNNPTGTVVRKAELDRFLETLPPGVLAVLDQAYYEYVDDPACSGGLEYISAGLPVIVLRTFSKAYGLAGLRIGYGIAPAGVIADLNRVREPFNVNSAAQAAALAALSDDGHLQRSRDLAAAGRRQLTEGLARLGLAPVPSQANFFFIDVKADSRQIFQALLRRGVIVRTGDIFGHPTFIRVTLGTAAQNNRFLNALAETLAEQ